MQEQFAYRGWVVTEEDVGLIRELIAKNPTTSRRKLSRLVCEARNFVQPNGAPRDMLCRGLMLQLHRAGLIELPPVRFVPNNPLARHGKPGQLPLLDQTPVRGGLSELGPLDFLQVRRSARESLFNSLIETYHYLGYTQPVGEHLKYLVYAQGRPVACFAWSSAARHLGPRDRFIGWSAEARKRNVRFVAYNSRFLVLPWVEVSCLASHLLARMAKRLSDDWEQVYGHPVYFLETFVHAERFKGTCYRAANWVYLGQTTGRGKNDQTNKPNRPLKDVLGYALDKRFRQLMSRVD
jgi:hypothetical protein